MNFLLGVVLFAAVYTKMGIPEPVNYLTVTGVAAGSPAEQAGILAGDKLIEFNENQEFVDYINARRGETVTLKLENREVEIVPRLAEDTPRGQGALGVGITNIDYVQYPFWQRPIRGAWLGLKEALAWGREILSSLGQMVVKLTQGEAPKDVAGPVGIYEISKSASAQGLLAVFQFTGILSINLAILNLLPLPALDGGRLFFILTEAITKKRANPKFEQAVHLVGMALLIGLMILVTINDVRRLIG
jgi:regulator of sigma E protease